MVTKAFKEWLGVAVEEYPDTGHELDVLSVTLNSIKIMVEIIWTPSTTNFYRDMTIILASDAHLKVVVVNPTIIINGEFRRAYEKMQASEILKGYRMSDMIDGQKLLTDETYLANDFKKLVLDLIGAIDESIKDKIKQLKSQILLNQPLSPIIANCLDLASKVGTNSEKNWLTDELYGYHERSVKVAELPENPDYRVIHGKLTVEFSAPTFREEKEYGYAFFDVRPVFEIESLLTNTVSDEFVFWFPVQREIPGAKQITIGGPQGTEPVIVTRLDMETCLNKLRLRLHKFLDDIEKNRLSKIK